MNTKISAIRAYEILDSRGVPTVECELALECGITGRASVPSGASTGTFEAHELRDGAATRYGGKGVLHAVENVDKRIAPALIGMDVCDLSLLDGTMLRLDGTPNKSNLGANAILSVSLASVRAASAALGIAPFQYLGGQSARTLPIPMMNILNGGVHAGNNLDVQEFMILPLGAESFSEALMMGATVQKTLKGILESRRLSTSVGDEGGFAPDLSGDEEALELLVEAIEKSGYNTDTVGIALDVASSDWRGEDGTYLLPKAGKRYAAEELIDRWVSLADRFPIVSIEDGLAEEDFGGWKLLTERLGDEIMLVGDDLFVTNTERLRRGLYENIANSILIKPNQIGTVSETLEVIALASQNGYTHVMSHRSGETVDSLLADLAVGTSAPFIKAGAPTRGERVAKYNRLLAIERMLGDGAVYGMRSV